MKVAIIGAGAAGLMCACRLPEFFSVTVFERNDAAGKKLLMTGNGRCNVTNLREPDDFLENVPRNSEFLSHAVNVFSPKDMVGFLGTLGIKTHVEDNMRVFPDVGGAAGIRNAMQKFAQSRGVDFKFHTVITTISKTDIGFVVNDKQFDAVIIATGGLSYSEGVNGYTLAKSLGHTITSTRPGMCGIVLKNPIKAQGASVRATIQIGDSAPLTGDILFTDYGISGPTVFKAVSRFHGDKISGQSLQINFAPDLTHTPATTGKNPFYTIRKFVPKSIANWLVQNGGATALTQSRLLIKDFRGIDGAIVTRGGVDVSQIENKTMESRLVKNLFFIGEVIDIDALSGGFNLQCAFSTAVACSTYLSTLA